MSRPPSQPVMRAPRPSHPMAPAQAAPASPAPAPVDQAPPPTPTEGEELRTFTTRLPVDLRRRLRRHAIDTDQTLEQVARAMIVEYLDRHEG